MIVLLSKAPACAQNYSTSKPQPSGAGADDASNTTVGTGCAISSTTVHLGVLVAPVLGLTGVVVYDPMAVDGTNTIPVGATEQLRAT